MNRRRREYGAYYHLVAELRLDRDRHLNYFRMNAEQMDHILSLIGGQLTRQTTNYRQSIEPKQRLAVTLRFLGTGESFTSLAFQYRLGISTVAESVHMTCQAIEQQMMASQFPRPTADADYRFTFVQVGDFGRTSDAGVFSSSALGRAMEAKGLSVPADFPLPGSGVQGPMPYTMVGDSAFPLKTYLMRPFPGNRIPRWRQMFSYRLSRARMVVECAFGILSSRWRVLHTRINVKPENADSIVTAACILHNYLTNPSENQRWVEEAEERGEVLPPVRNMGGKGGCREAYDVREKLCTFFCSIEGRVSWQDNMV
ncbi:hypothetical protein PO909_034127 [Leuciscus waleckii]